MQTSANYGLKLFEGTDNVKRQDFVDNFQKIDSTMKSIDDSKTPLYKITSAIDFNTLTATGIYDIEGTTTNAPVAGNGRLIVNFSVGTPYQIWMHDTDMTMYKRTYNGITWSSWNNLFTAGNIGLGNVTNESKTTMFTSPVFTGTPTLPDTKLTGDIYSADGTERHFKNGSTNALWGYYVNGNSIGAYDWTNSRSIFNYSPTGNAFSIMPNGGTVGTKNVVLDDGSGSMTVSNYLISKGTLQLNNNGTSTLNGVIVGNPTANYYLNGTVVGDTILRNDTNTDILLGFKGANGNENPALKIAYNATGASKVSTQRNTLDDGSGNIIMSNGILGGSQHDFHVVPASNSNVGFTNNARTKWGLEVSDNSTGNPTAKTYNNTIDDGSGNMAVVGTMSVAYPSTGNGVQVGATSDYNGNTFALGVASSASTSKYPFGVLTGGGTSAKVALGVKTDGSTYTLNNTYLDDGKGNMVFANKSDYSFRGVMGTIGDNDYWRVGGGATANDSGYLEIATSDSGTEPIYVRQYNNPNGSAPTFTTVARTLTLLDSNGNTIIPGCTYGHKFMADESSGTDGGFSFTQDGANDTGMFSSGDGVLNFYSNGNMALTLSNDASYQEGNKLRGYDIVRSLSGGYLIQSGALFLQLVSGGQVSATITFPTAFTHGVPNIFAVLDDVGYGTSKLTTGVGAVAQSNTQAQVTVKQDGTATGTVCVKWLAIGI